MKTYITLINCPDRKGLIAAASGAIADIGGNILDSLQHVDPDHSVPTFLMRLEWEIDDWTGARRAEFDLELRRLTGGIVETHDSKSKRRIAVMATKERHCLDEIVGALRRSEIDLEVAFIGSNYVDLRATVEKDYGIEFRHFPIIPGEDRKIQEAAIFEAIKESGCDMIFLAKYMQVLSANFIEKSPMIVNIHHSFLPAFKGGNAYRQAYDRGVKLIAATTHIVTPEIDEGPIIRQKPDVVDGCSYPEFVERGHTLERLASLETLRLLAHWRVIRYDNKTIVL